MFKRDSIVSFSQTDSEGKLSTAALFEYFQDTSELHSESLGDAAGEDADFAWILNSWQVQIRSLPVMRQNALVLLF